MLHPSVEHIFESGTTITKDGEEVPLRSSVSKAEAQLLCDVVREIEPEQSVEIGMGQGISTLAILGSIEANGHGHHHVIDPYAGGFKGAALAAIEKAGLDAHMTFYDRHSETVVPTLPQLDFAFIDASHLFDMTLSDFVMIDKILKVGGVIGFHDLWLPSYRGVIDYILSNREYIPYKWSTGERAPTYKPRGRLNRLVISARHALGTLPPSAYAPNLSLIQKTGRDTRTWDYHVPF